MEENNHQDKIYEYDTDRALEDSIIQTDNLHLSDFAPESLTVE